MSPTCTMVLLKLHCEVMEATLSALVAMVSGGRDGASPTRSTDAPAEVRAESQEPKQPRATRKAVISSSTWWRHYSEVTDANVDKKKDVIEGLEVLVSHRV